MSVDSFFHCKYTTLFFVNDKHYKIALLRLASDFMRVNTNPSICNLITCLFIQFELKHPSIDESKDKDLILFLFLSFIPCL